MKDWDKMTPLEEIYEIRREIASDNGFDLDRIFEAARESQREAVKRGRVFVSLPLAKRHQTNDYPEKSISPVFA